MCGIHFCAMSAAIGALDWRRKPLKTLLIILLVVWIAPSLLLFFYLGWKGQLLARYGDWLRARLAEPKPNLTKRNQRAAELP